MPTRFHPSILLPLALAFPLTTWAEAPTGTITYTSESSALVLTAEFGEGRVHAICALPDGRYRREFSGEIAPTEGLPESLEGRAEWSGGDGGTVEYTFDTRGGTAELLWTATGGPGPQWTKWERTDSAGAAPVVKKPANAPSLSESDLSEALGRGRAFVQAGMDQDARGEDPGESYRKAIAVFDEVLTRNPESGRAYADRGRAFVELGTATAARGSDPGDSYRKAIADFGEALKRNPESVETFSDRGSAFESLGDAARVRGEDPSKNYQAASDDFDAALARGPRSWAAYQEKGEILEKMGKPAKALESYERALALAGGDNALVNGCVKRARKAVAAAADPGKPPAKEHAPAVAAGPFEARGQDGLKRDLITRGGGTAGSELAVQAALLWLARHQSEDGSWSSAGFDKQCTGPKCGGAGNGDYDAGLTGLSLLAFLGAGYTHLSDEEVKDDITGKTFKYGKVVKEAIRWIVNNQGPDGCIGPQVSKVMYNHAICAMALAEAYGMTESAILKEPAQKAIGFLIQAKNPYKAWRYSARCGENDTSVTGWCVMALKSAKASGLTVPDSTLQEAKAFVADVTDGKTAKCGYQAVEDAGVKVVVPGKNEDYANHDAMSAVSLVVRAFVDRDRADPILGPSSKLLTSDLPEWDEAKKTNDYYYWYYGTLALFQVEGPDSGGSRVHWKAWNAAVLDALVGHQSTKDAGCAAGSWPADDRWGFDGGGVYATAINALTLEIYYRYPSVFAKATPGHPRDAPHYEEIIAAEKLIDALAAKGYGALSDEGTGDQVRKVAKVMEADVTTGLHCLEIMIASDDGPKRALTVMVLDSMDAKTVLPIFGIALTDRKDAILRRLASSYLARKQLDEALPLLEKAMKEDEDWGVRGNSAYGLAKAGRRKGIECLLGIYRDGSRTADERLGILGSIADLADPTTAPFFEDLLGSTTDDTTLLLAISAVEKMGDRGALEALQALIDGNGRDPVKASAKKAYDSIHGR